jgi:hypothetical protein
LNVRNNSIAAHKRDTGYYLMPLTGKHGEHPDRVVDIDGLADYLVVDNHCGIGSKDDAVGLGRNRFCFFDRQAENIIHGRFAIANAFVNIGDALIKRPTDRVEYLGPPRTLGRKDDFWKFDHSLLE